MNRQKREVKFLGNIITTEGIMANPCRNTVMREMQEHNNVSELCNLLGMVNQLGEFVTQLAEKDKSLRRPAFQKKPMVLQG